MSWLDSSGFGNFATQALKQVQKKIDKVLDIPDEEISAGGEKRPGTGSAKSKGKAPEADDFFNTYLDKNSPTPSAPPTQTSPRSPVTASPGQKMSGGSSNSAEGVSRTSYKSTPKTAKSLPDPGMVFSPIKREELTDRQQNVSYHGTATSSSSISSVTMEEATLRKGGIEVRVLTNQFQEINLDANSERVEDTSTGQVEMTDVTPITLETEVDEGDHKGDTNERVDAPPQQTTVNVPMTMSNMQSTIGSTWEVEFDDVDNNLEEMLRSEKEESFVKETESGEYHSESLASPSVSEAKSVRTPDNLEVDHCQNYSEVETVQNVAEEHDSESKQVVVPQSAKSPDDSVDDTHSSQTESLEQKELQTPETSLQDNTDSVILSASEGTSHCDNSETAMDNTEGPVSVSSEPSQIIEPQPSEDDVGLRSEVSDDIQLSLQSRIRSVLHKKPPKKKKVPTATLR